VIWSGCPFPTSLSSQSHFFTLSLFPSNPSCSLSPLYLSSRCFDSQKGPSVSPLPATLTNSSQLHDNTTTLSPAFATLTNRVMYKPFACHSCKKHPGWGVVEQALACSPFLQPVTDDSHSPRFTTGRFAALSIFNSPLSIFSVSPLESTAPKHLAGVDSKSLTASLKPLDATLTKNAGEGRARPISQALNLPCREFNGGSTIHCLPIEEEIRHGHSRSENSRF